jgi:hypothetical protein
MTDRRGSRFILEVLFLLALTVALTLANLRAIEIAGIMLIGWVIVAVLEWVAWREEPHYGSGLPPRYYVPQVNLPPAQPLESVSPGYPEARDEAPTWIASPALRAEMLGPELAGEWPVAAPPVTGSPVVPPLLTPPPLTPPPLSTTSAAPEPEVDDDPWTRAEELPAAPLGELEPEQEVEPESEPESEPEPAGLPEPLVALEQPEFIPPPVSMAIGGKPVGAHRPEAVQPEAMQPEGEPELAQPAAVVAEPLAAEAEPSLDKPSVDEPSLEGALARSVQGVARYSLDPLADPEPRRRFGRGAAAAEPDGVEVPARPEGVRALPGRTNRQD